MAEITYDAVVNVAKEYIYDSVLIIAYEPLYDTILQTIIKIENLYDVYVQMSGYIQYYDTIIQNIIENEKLYDIIVLIGPAIHTDIYDLIVNIGTTTDLNNLFNALIENNAYVYNFIVNDTKITTPDNTVEFKIKINATRNNYVYTVKNTIVAESIFKWKALKTDEFNIIYNNIGKLLTFEYMYMSGMILFTNIKYTEHIGVEYKNVTAKCYILLEAKT